MRKHQIPLIGIELTDLFIMSQLKFKYRPSVWHKMKVLVCESVCGLAILTSNQDSLKKKITTGFNAVKRGKNISV